LTFLTPWRACDACSRPVMTPEPDLYILFVDDRLCVF
jgi:hypothetical protein